MQFLQDQFIPFPVVYRFTRIQIIPAMVLSAWKKSFVAMVLLLALSSGLGIMSQNIAFATLAASLRSESINRKDCCKFRCIVTRSQHTNRSASGGRGVFRLSCLASRHFTYFARLFEVETEGSENTLSSKQKMEISKVVFCCQRAKLGIFQTGGTLTRGNYICVSPGMTVRWWQTLVVPQQGRWCRIRVTAVRNAPLSVTPPKKKEKPSGDSQWAA